MFSPGVYAQTHVSHWQFKKVCGLQTSAWTLGQTPLLQASRVAGRSLEQRKRVLQKQAGGPVSTPTARSPPLLSSGPQGIKAQNAPHSPLRADQVGLG